ncbi:MAG TPA: DUF2165 domain-containing protein [Pseudonocardiaceae bacterium]
MRLLAWLGNTGTTVAIFAGITALQITLIAAGNITDFGTNKEFVVHVLAMDTTFRSPNTMWHAITDPGTAIGVYITVIVWECLTATVLICACIAWTRVGGEWFQMWQSSMWNGLQSALRYFLIASVGLILAQLPQRELPGRP